MSSRPTVAVGCVVEEGKKVLLVRRKRPPNAGLLAVPGGKVEYGETLEKAVKREMKEETGLTVSIRSLLAVVEVIKEDFHYVILDYICERLNGEPRASSDALEIVWLGLSELEIHRSEMSPSTYEMLLRWRDGEKLPLSVVSTD